MTQFRQLSLATAAIVGLLAPAARADGYIFSDETYSVVDWDSTPSNKWQCQLYATFDRDGLNLLLTASKEAVLFIPGGGTGQAWLTVGGFTVKGDMTTLPPSDTIPSFTSTVVKVDTTQPGWSPWLETLPEHTIEVYGQGAHWSRSLTGMRDALRSLIDCAQTHIRNGR